MRDKKWVRTNSDKIVAHLRKKDEPFFVKDLTQKLNVATSKDIYPLIKAAGYVMIPSTVEYGTREPRLRYLLAIPPTTVERLARKTEREIARRNA